MNTQLQPRLSKAQLTPKSMRSYGERWCATSTAIWQEHAHTHAFYDNVKKVVLWFYPISESLFCAHNSLVQRLRPKETAVD